MTLYAAVWPDVPRSQYDALSTELKQAFDEKFELVLTDPHGIGDYDKIADQWSTDFADGVGFLTYIVNDRTVRVVVLRIYST